MGKPKEGGDQAPSQEVIKYLRSRGIRDLENYDLRHSFFPGGIRPHYPRLNPYNRRDERSTSTVANPDNNGLPTQTPLTVFGSRVSQAIKGPKK